MVDVADKDATHRIALAAGYIRVLPETLKLIQEGGHKKGDVLGIARIAGIMAAKRTSELIPLCHPLTLTHISIEFTPDPDIPCVRCLTKVKSLGQTGVEIEAICATQIALLTIYDMCKAVDRGMSIEQVQLLEKAGGKSGRWLRGSQDQESD